MVEVPPGPPVMSPIVAEIYGPDYEEQKRLGRKLQGIYEATPDIVDIDSTIEAEAKRLVIEVDRQRAAMLGVSQQAVAAILQMALSGEDVTYIHQARERYPIPVRLEVPVASKADLERCLRWKCGAEPGNAYPFRR